MSTIKKRSSELVSLNGFRDAGIPEEFGYLELQCPEDRQYILRMVVRVEGKEYLFPPQFDWLRPMFDVSLSNQKALGVDHPFCYITVRHGIVNSEADDEWHVDGFSMRIPHVPEQNYVWCSKVGTEYAYTDVYFPTDFDPLVHNVHTFLERFVSNEIGTCKEKTVYCLDPYLLHRRPARTNGIFRTFVRVSFVPIEIDDFNNTQNPLLPREYNRDGLEYRRTLKTYVWSRGLTPP